VGGREGGKGGGRDEEGSRSYATLEGQKETERQGKQVQALDVCQTSAARPGSDGKGKWELIEGRERGEEGARQEKEGEEVSSLGKNRTEFQKSLIILLTFCPSELLDVSPREKEEGRRKTSRPQVPIARSCLVRTPNRSTPSSEAGRVVDGADRRGTRRAGKDHDYLNERA